MRYLTRRPSRYTTFFLAAFPKGGTTSFYELFPQYLQRRFSYGAPHDNADGMAVLMNVLGWGEARVREREGEGVMKVLLMREPVERAMSEWAYRSNPGKETNSLSHARPEDTFDT